MMRRLLLDLSEVDGNSAASAGGMHIVSDNGAEATIRRSAVFENEATSAGGLYLRSDNFGSVIVSNSTVSENSSSGAGGGISALRAKANATLRVDNSTVSGNLVSGNPGLYGGGVYVNNVSYHVLVDNSIVANNMVNGSGDDVSGLIAANFSLFESTTAMSSVSGNDLIINQDPMLGPLTDNGGTTPTHYLLPGSPAIDTGSPFYSGSFDQRGAPYARVVDGDGNGSVIVDMGAFEKQTSSNNVAPVADAGPNQETDVETPVTLDGSGSSDLDDGPQPLMFMWQLIAGVGNVQFSAPNSAVTEFTADLPGTYVVLLTVDDGADQNTDTVNVVVNRVNHPPVANVSLSENMGNTSQSMLLDGSRSSDPDMDPLTFDWSVIAQPDGSTPVIDDATAEVTSWRADLPGTYRMQLIVNDGIDSSDPVTFTIDVIEVNLPPIADVSLSQNQGVVFSLISLNGSRSSDPEGED